MCLRHKVRLRGGFVRAFCLLSWLNILPADVLARKAFLTGHLHDENVHHDLPTFERRTITAFNDPNPSNRRQGFTDVQDRWENFDFLKLPSLQNSKFIFQSFDKNDENDNGVSKLSGVHWSHKPFVIETQPDGTGQCKSITTKQPGTDDSVRECTGHKL